MDRFLPPSPEVIKAYCDVCGQAILARTEVYEINGCLIHEDCIGEQNGRLKIIEEVIG